MAVHQTLSLRESRVWPRETSTYIPFTGRKFTNSPGSPSEQALVWYRVDKAAVVARQPNEPRPQSRSLQRVAQDAAQMQPRERMQLHQLTHRTTVALKVSPQGHVSGRSLSPQGRCDGPQGQVSGISPQSSGSSLR